MNRAFYITLFLLLLSFGANMYFLLTPKQCVYDQIVVKDTVFVSIRDIDTVYVNNTMYRHIYHYDTVVVNDKVYIKDTLYDYYFEQDDYTLNVSAVRLDKYKLDIHLRDTVRINTIMHQPVKKERWSIGITGGVGYGLINKKPDAYVGVGITYKLN